MTTLADELRTWRDRSRDRIAAATLAPRLEQIGRVVQTGDGVAQVAGLPDTRLDELLVFENGVRGLAVDLGEDVIGCVLLGDGRDVGAGSIVHGTGTVAEVPVGDPLLGRVVDALGVPIDDGPPLPADIARQPVEQP